MALPNDLRSLHGKSRKEQDLHYGYLAMTITSDADKPRVTAPKPFQVGQQKKP